MSNIHILQRHGEKIRVVFHFPTPPGTNSANGTWKAVLLAAGVAGTTVLTEGTGLGNISAQEKSSIQSGDVLELETTIQLDMKANNAQRVAAIDEMYSKIMADYLDDLQAAYKFYGVTR